MDWLTFVAKVIEVLAWPVTVVTLTVLLREPLTKLILNIRKLRYRGAEADFGTALAEAAGQPKADAPSVVVSANQLRLAELSPRGAILEAWLELEDALGNAAEKEGIARTRAGGFPGRLVSVDPWALAQQLCIVGRLDPPSLERFKKLRHLRNTAVHLTDEAITPSEAEAFLRLVAELKLELKAPNQSLQPTG